jgi:hypothetical protein
VTRQRDVGYMGFVMSSSNPIRYFVTHYYQHKIFIFDEEWNLISEKSSFTHAHSMISVAKNFYMTGWGNELKIDEQLNVFINYTDSDAGYNGLYYSLNY